MRLLDYINANTPKKSNKPTLGLLGELWDSFGNNPRNQETVDAMKGMFGLLPLGAGDVASGLLAADDVRRGDYFSAGLNGVGVLPYVPALGGTIFAKGRGLFNLPLDESAYTAQSLGSQGQQILHNGSIVGKTTGKLKNAVGDFIDELKGKLDDYNYRSQSAKTGASTRLKNAQSSDMLRNSFNEYKSLIDIVHKNSNLSFSPISNDAFDRGVFIHKSPNYGKKSGSAYRLIDVNGEPAYARQSDHWGNFSTNRYDEYGNLVSDNFNWTLPGAEKSSWGNNDRYTGYILLKDLLNK